MDYDSTETSYWDFDYNDLAEKDLPAMIEKVVEVNGDCKKVTLVGHSLGGTILANGLSKSSKAKNYVAQAVSIAPCFIPTNNSYIWVGDGGEMSTALGLFAMRFENRSFFGPDWSDIRDEVC